MYYASQISRMFTLPFKVILAILSHLFSYLGKSGKLSKGKRADECSSWKLDGCLVPSQARLTLGFLIILLEFKFIWYLWILSGLVLLMKSRVISSCLVLCTPKAISWWLCWWKTPLGFFFYIDKPTKGSWFWPPSPEFSVQGSSLLLEASIVCSTLNIVGYVYQAAVLMLPSLRMETSTAGH